MFCLINGIVVGLEGLFIVSSSRRTKIILFTPMVPQLQGRATQFFVLRRVRKLLLGVRGTGIVRRAFPTHQIYLLEPVNFHPANLVSISVSPLKN